MAQQVVFRSSDTAKWAKALERAITEALDVLVNPSAARLSWSRPRAPVFSTT